MNAFKIGDQVDKSLNRVPSFLDKLARKDYPIWQYFDTIIWDKNLK